MQKLVFCWSFSWETLQIICLCILTLMRPPGLGAEGASISSIWSVLPVLLQESCLQLVILCVVQTEPNKNVKWIRFIMVCFHKVNAGKMCMYMYLDYFQTESLKTEPFFCSKMVKQKYSFKCKDGTLSSTQAKLKKVKKEKNRTANEQEQVMKNRSHQGDKLNLWKVEDMEAAVKE